MLLICWHLELSNCSFCASRFERMAEQICLLAILINIGGFKWLNKQSNTLRNDDLSTRNSLLLTQRETTAATELRNNQRQLPTSSQLIWSRDHTINYAIALVLALTSFQRCLSIMETFSRFNLSVRLSTVVTGFAASSYFHNDKVSTWNAFFTAKLSVSGLFTSSYLHEM